MLREHLPILNSLTKYPSIPTYHVMGEKGRLTPERIPMPAAGPFQLTEKLDGTNVRIVMLPSLGMWFVGSREELLTERTDLVHNPVLGIVDGVRAHAVRSFAKLCSKPNTVDNVYTLYGELFGGKAAGMGKQYGQSRTDFNLFDVAVEPWLAFREKLQTFNPERAAHWRDNGNQAYLNLNQLALFASELDLRLVPSIDVVDSLPDDLEPTEQFLRAAIQTTRRKLDDKALGRPEGLVARTGDRKWIAKLRFEDYERTLRRKA